MSEALLTEALKLGFVVLLLLTAVIGLVRWVHKLMGQQDAREERARNESSEREAKARQECLEREERLSIRLTAVEDRQHGENAQLLTRAVSALEINAHAVDRLCERDSGMHRALDPKHN